MRLRDLIVDHATGRLSHTKFWNNIANVIMSLLMLRQEAMEWELLAAYGTVVGGSHVAIYWLKRRYNGPTPDAADKLENHRHNRPVGE